MIADPDTLLIALYVELTDRIIPAQHPLTRMGRPPVVTDAELGCLAVAQVLLRHDDERRWLRAPPSRIATPRSARDDQQRAKWSHAWQNPGPITLASDSQHIRGPVPA